jgi:uncharacterized membrane protein YoaK (UPF0700 family)
MPLFYLRRLTGSQRSDRANRHLARYLACIAGAANAGGFLAVRQYTSHMSGIVSAMADNLAAGSVSLVFDGLAAVASFMAGAFLTTLSVRWSRRRHLESIYAMPLMAEAALLVIFGLTGEVFHGGYVLSTVLLLCFTMGLQNAIITKISEAVIRTTHLTGMVTDIGIALGRLASRGTDTVVSDDLQRLRLLGSLIFLFFAGGVVGALGFKHIGFLFTIPLAAVLVLLAVMPVLDDMRRTNGVAA